MPLRHHKTMTWTKMAGMAAPRSDPKAPDTGDMRRSYIRVLITWILVLAGLFAFQEYFS